MLRSRGISQICHTYSEDMHPIYPPLPWLLRGGWVHILLLGVVYPIYVHVHFFVLVCTCTNIKHELIWCIPKLALTTSNGTTIYSRKDGI